jgi:RAD54-like protein 2
MLVFQTNGCFTDYEEGFEGNSYKLELFLDILEETILAGDRLLLFSQSLLTLNLIEEFLRKRQIPGNILYSSRGQSLISPLGANFDPQG